MANFGGVEINKESLDNIRLIVNIFLSDHKQRTLDVSSALVKDTKNLALRGADKQQNIAEVAEGSVQRIQDLSEAVKKCAGSLTSKNSESQVMLLTSVKDVATALHDLLQARKGMSGSKKDDESITKPAQVRCIQINTEKFSLFIYFIQFITLYQVSHLILIVYCMFILLQANEI